MDLGAALIWLTACGRASWVLTTGINELGSSAQLRGENTLPAEMLGFLHLSAAQMRGTQPAARRRAGHLAEAGQIAARIGERNGLRMHFSPANRSTTRHAPHADPAQSPGWRPSGRRLQV
ncbi:MAG: hypothetical protein ACRDTD_12400 [Pseudonocardiaceae bacterium]